MAEDHSFWLLEVAGEEEHHARLEGAVVEDHLALPEGVVEAGDHHALLEGVVEAEDHLALLEGVVEEVEETEQVALQGEGVGVEEAEEQLALLQVGAEVEAGAEEQLALLRAGMGVGVEEQQLSRVKGKEETGSVTLTGEDQ